MSTIRVKPRYSVMRIERAKQKALTGEAFKPVHIPGRMHMDWNRDDEADLCALIEKWDRKTGHAGLNHLIDEYKFSHGIQYENSGLQKMIEQGVVVESCTGEKCMERIVVVTGSEGRVTYETRQYPLIDDGAVRHDDFGRRRPVPLR